MSWSFLLYRLLLAIRTLLGVAVVVFVLTMRSEQGMCVSALVAKVCRGSASCAACGIDQSAGGVAGGANWRIGNMNRGRFIRRHWLATYSRQ